MDIEAMSVPAVMSGTMRLTPSGELAGTITDPFGFVTRISGIPTGEPGVWAISAVVVVPADLRISFLDDEAAA
jgi:hypothetical protein